MIRIYGSLAENEVRTEVLLLLLAITHIPDTVAHLCYQFNHVFALLISMPCLKSRKCQDHRSGFRHQIAGTLAAYYIAFFSLIRFKYGTLTCQM